MRAETQQRESASRRMLQTADLKRQWERSTGMSMDEREKSVVEGSGSDLVGGRTGTIASSREGRDGVLWGLSSERQGRGGAKSRTSY